MIRSKYLENIVSRETMEKIAKYHDILLENNSKMSIISKNSEKIAVERHYEDSAQLYLYLDRSDKDILDIGTGGGLPGVILDLIKHDVSLDFNTHLLDKSSKKCHFLEKVNSFLDLDLKIHNSDVMDLKKKDFTTIVSRAFKPMKEFFEIITASGLSYKKILLMKGENFMNEFSEAKKYFEINCEYHDSVTNQASKIFVIKSVSKI